MIAVIDYDAGNVRSVEKAIEYLGEKTVLTRDRDILLQADKVILPGVGNFGDAMEKINLYHLEPVIKSIIENKTPFLGICLGLQLLFEKSEENDNIQGLGILKGTIRKIPESYGLKVPQIGWNDLSYPNKGKLFAGIPEYSYVYFVHGYYLDAEDKSIVTATTEYGITVDASVEKDNVFACQFHPEKSSAIGLKILSNFVHLKKGE